MTNKFWLILKSFFLNYAGYQEIYSKILLIFINLNIFVSINISAYISKKKLHKDDVSIGS